MLVFCEFVVVSVGFVVICVDGCGVLLCGSGYIRFCSLSLSQSISPHTRSQHEHKLESLTKHRVVRGGEATHPARFLVFFFRFI